MARRGEPTAYGAVARDLRAAILRGEYGNDTRLPTEAELAATYKVSRPTVRRAFHDLVTEGLVKRVPGRGTFVARRDRHHLRLQFSAVGDLMAVTVETKLEVLSPLRHRVDVDAAGRLGLDSDHVANVVILRRHDDTPMCVTTVHFPLDVAALLSDVSELTVEGAVSEGTIIGLLDARLPDPISEAEQSITAVAAADGLLRVLSCEPGAPLLRTDRLYRTGSGRAVELATSYFVPELYSYRAHLRRNPL